MTDTPGNSGDQPVPTEPLASEPAAPPANQPPPWAPQTTPPPPAQAWSPPPPPQAQVWAPPPPSDAQTWAPPPASASPSEPWTPQAPQPPYGAPPATTSGGRSLLFPIISAILVVLLIAVSAFAFITISSTNKNLDDTKASLASEQSARQSADAKVVALSGCIDSMKTDTTALTVLVGAMATAASRTITSGDIDTARLAYETAVLQALTDEHQSLVNVFAATTQAQEDAAFQLGVKGENEMKAAAILKTNLDTMVKDFTSQVGDSQDQSATLSAQIGQTTTECDAASGGSTGPAPSAKPSTSAKPSAKPTPTK